MVGGAMLPREDKTMANRYQNPALFTLRAYLGHNGQWSYVIEYDAEDGTRTVENSSVDYASIHDALRHGVTVLDAWRVRAGAAPFAPAD